MLDNILRLSDYASFKDALSKSACSLCPLSQSRRKLVIDRGNPDARVLFIGEAPGAEEDKEGRAFVGRSGKLLDKLCREAGIDTQKDCLIINIVKCRPPENRPPTDAEALSCRPFLEKQIELINPDCILFLGRTALRALGPEYKKRPISSLVGTFFSDKSFPKTKLMILYHPAYILRNRSKENEFIDHLRVFKRSYEENFAG